MAFYSFRVQSPGVVSLPKWYVLLDRGVNVCTAVIEDLEEFREALKHEGVELLEVNDLTEPMDGAVEPAYLLPGRNDQP